MSQQTLPIGDHEEKTILKIIEVKLGVTEEAVLRREAQEIRTGMKELKAAFEERKSDFNTEYKKLEAKFDQAMDKMSAQREVECIQKTFFENNVVQIWNGDELIEERALTADERQLSMGAVQHGVVLSHEEKKARDFADSPDGADFEPMTEEEAEKDLKDVMRDERSPFKPSLVN